MGVCNHWGGTVNVRAGGDRVVYHVTPEKNHIIHCDSSYHELMSGTILESETVPFQKMAGASRPVYPMDKGGACSSGDGDRIRVNKNQRERESGLG